MLGFDRPTINRFLKHVRERTSAHEEIIGTNGERVTYDRQSSDGLMDRVVYTDASGAEKLISVVFPASSTRHPRFPTSLPFVPMRAAELSDLAGAGMYSVAWDKQPDADALFRLVVDLCLDDGWIRPPMEQSRFGKQGAALFGQVSDFAQQRGVGMQLLLGSNRQRMISGMWRASKEGQVTLAEMHLSMG